MSESDYADCDANDPFALAAVSVLEASLEPFVPLISQGCRAALLSQLADFTARRLEEMTMSKRFTAV